MYEVRERFERRYYDQARFAEPVSLTGQKCELSLSVSLLLPFFRATQRVKALINEIHALNEWAPFVDQLAVITASSSPDMDTAFPGVEVYSGDELMPEYGPVIGKGDAMWRALSIASGDLVVCANVEAPAFDSHFVCGVLGPLPSFPRVKFAKAAYEDLVWGALDIDEPEVDEALAELTSRPLLNLHYSVLSGFSQRLSRESPLRTSCFVSYPSTPAKHRR